MSGAVPKWRSVYVVMFLSPRLHAELAGWNGSEKRTLSDAGAVDLLSAEVGIWNLPMWRPRSSIAARLEVEHLSEASAVSAVTSGAPNRGPRPAHDGQ